MAYASSTSPWLQKNGVQTTSKPPISPSTVDTITATVEIALDVGLMVLTAILPGLAPATAPAMEALSANLPWIMTGIGLGMAATRTAYRGAYGKLNWTNVAADFGFALLPGVSELNAGRKAGRNLARNFKQASEMTASELKTFKNQVNVHMKETVSNYKKQIVADYKKSKDIKKTWSSATMARKGKAHDLALKRRVYGIKKKMEDMKKLYSSEPMMKFIKEMEDQIRAFEQYAQTQVLPKELKQGKFVSRIKRMNNLKAEFPVLFKELPAGLESDKIFQELRKGNPIIGRLGTDRRYDRFFYSKKMMNKEALAIDRFNKVETVLRMEAATNKDGVTGVVEAAVESASFVPKRTKSIKKYRKKKFPGPGKTVPYSSVAKDESKRFLTETSWNTEKKIIKSLKDLWESGKIPASIKREFGDSKNEFINSVFAYTGRRLYAGKLGRITKFVGSAHFNDRYVQLAQLVDPNDLGRWGPERVYRLGKNRISGAMERSRIKKLDKLQREIIARVKETGGQLTKADIKRYNRKRFFLKDTAFYDQLKKTMTASKVSMELGIEREVDEAAFKREIRDLESKSIKGRAKEFRYRKKVPWQNDAKFAKETREEERALVAAGGHLFARNRYIIGYKVMPIDRKINGKFHLVMLRFNKYRTGSHDVTGKNHGGKKDVLILATTRDLKKFRDLPSAAWYWDHGRKVGWYVNRGGNRARRVLAELPHEMSLFLMMIPIPALRNALSIMSNWVESAADIASGQYAKQYMAKFTSAISKTTIMRASRLATRVAAGGLASHYLGSKGGRYVGTELQRWSTFGLSLGVKKDNVNGGIKVGNFAGHQLGQKATRTALGGMNIMMVRHSRRTPYSEKHNMQNGKRISHKKSKNNRMMAIRSSRRKWTQLRRVPGAAKPGSFKWP